jgi:hypothetical protein
MVISLFRSFFEKRWSRKEEKQDILYQKYIESLVRYEKEWVKLEKISSPFLKPLYINENLITLLISCKRSDIQSAILEKIVSYDDFETLFQTFFKINHDDTLHIQQFVKPFYKKNIHEKSILKCITYIFTFFIQYFHFYMILHEFLEVEKEDLASYFTLFLAGDEAEKEKKRLFHHSISYYYFSIHISTLFTLFYQTIHFLQDVTTIQYDFDIHNLYEMKKHFYQCIHKSKEKNKKRD